MKYSIITIVILFVISISLVGVQASDYSSVSSHYSQYSPDNLNNRVNQAEQQYSPSNINTAYNQYGMKYSPSSINTSYNPQVTQSFSNNISNLPQQPHDYHVNLVSPQAAAGKAAKQAKKPPEDPWVDQILDHSAPKKQVPVFLYLSIISSLAVVATILIIIGTFKKKY